MHVQYMYQCIMYTDVGLAMGGWMGSGSQMPMEVDILEGDVVVDEH